MATSSFACRPQRKPTLERADQLREWGWCAVGAYVIYAIIWAPLFGVAWLMNKAGHDAITQQIFDILHYAGYPIIGLLWLAWQVFYFILCLFGIVILFLFRITFPYGLYCLPLIMTLYLLYMIYTRINRK